jgi:hypothetical protein
MNALTCQEAEAHLDLLAAGECDPLTRQSVERHLEHCPACTASYRESKRLVGLLDLTLNDTGLSRLRARIEQEDLRLGIRRVRGRRALLPFARRAIAMAAMVLLAVGLAWLPHDWQRGSEAELQLTAITFRGDALEKQDFPVAVRASPDAVPGFMKLAGNVLTVGLPPTQLGESFRRELRDAQLHDRLPAPTSVPLALAIRNSDKHAFEVRLGDANTVLSLDVNGEGVVRIPYTGDAKPSFLQPQSHWLAPGESRVIRIDHLVAGSTGRLEYIYLTEPGDSKLVALLRLWADGHPAIVESNPTRIQVAIGSPPHKQ